MSAFDPPEDALPPPPAVGEAGEVGGVTDRRRAASGIEEDVEKKDSLLEDLKRALNGELEVGEAGIAEWEWARNKTFVFWLLAFSLSLPSSQRAMPAPYD
jgi:hypothetical protein